MKVKHLLKSVIILGFILTLSGCNKEKAEALKVAAETFKTNATEALNKISELFKQNISVVSPTDNSQLESTANDLLSIENIDASVLSFLAAETEIGSQQEEEINKKFDSLKNQYYQFEAIFSSLDKGSFLAKNAVKKAEKYAINLTLQLINYADLLHKNDFKFVAQRVTIIEQMNSAKQAPNAESQKTKMKEALVAFYKLLDQEKTLKEDAIKQCYKSAENGRLVAELIRDYEKMNVSDIINSIKNTMTYTLDITNNNQDISNLYQKFEGIEKAIKEDPYWSILLKKQIN